MFLRYFGPRPLNGHIGYRVNRNVRLVLDVFNVFDRKVDDIAYFYASRLPGEPAGVDDVHFHPAEPRTFRAGLVVTF